MKFMFTCGGTAGHIYPAISVADRLREKYPDAEFLFVGVEGNMETELVPREGYPIKTLVVSGLRRSLKPADIIYNIRSLYRTESATIKAKKIVKDFAPDAVLGTGGYVCYPVIRAARALGVPTLVHESNAYPGLTTKMLEKYADKYHLIPNGHLVCQAENAEVPALFIALDCGDEGRLGAAAEIFQKARRLY